MNDIPGKNTAPGETRDASKSSEAFVGVIASKDEYTDDRPKWEWASRYPREARFGIRVEAGILIGMLSIFSALAGVFLGLANEGLKIDLGVLFSLQSSSNNSSQLMLSVDFRFLALFFSGSVGGTTFSIKWLIHAAAKGKWHLDRRYWRLLVPFLGGIYACVVLTLFDGGLIGGGQSISEPRPIAVAAALAFLVGYFSDGVSGLLSNVANAVFGTLEKK